MTFKTSACGVSPRRQNFLWLPITCRLKSQSDVQGYLWGAIQPPFQNLPACEQGQGMPGVLAPCLPACERGQGMPGVLATLPKGKGADPLPPSQGAGIRPPRAQSPPCPSPQASP